MMEQPSDKRKVPPMLQKLLRLDVNITRKLVEIALQTSALQSLKRHSYLLEWSCHGIIWLAAWLSFIWLASHPSVYQLQVNTFIALIFDIVVIAILKAVVRRRRPLASANNSAFGPDKYSFPSGHASRAFMLAFIFIYLDPISKILVPPILAWACAVALSRILVEKHYLLDVVAGIGLGIFEGIFISLIWLSQDTSRSFLQMLSDDKRDGGEYHV